MKKLKVLILIIFFGIITFNVVTVNDALRESDLCLLSAKNIALADSEIGDGTIRACWQNFNGGIAWCFMCTPCERFPFATPTGSSSYCLQNP